MTHPQVTAPRSEERRFTDGARWLVPLADGRVIEGPVALQGATGFVIFNDSNLRSRKKERALGAGF